MYIYMQYKDNVISNAEIIIYILMLYIELLRYFVYNLTHIQF